jgi:hypothetical protein
MVPPAPPVKEGFCNKVQIQIEDIEKEILSAKDLIAKFEHHMGVQSSINLYLGTAFVVFEKPRHSNLILEYDN